MIQASQEAIFRMTTVRVAVEPHLQGPLCLLNLDNNILQEEWIVITELT
jgi:hypothetical protein